MELIFEEFREALNVVRIRCKLVLFRSCNFSVNVIFTLDESGNHIYTHILKVVLAAAVSESQSWWRE